MTQLLSVHVAKAGGSSLLRLFQQAYGDALLPDYAENPADPLSPRVLDPARYAARQGTFPPGIACIHGHFHPAKYVITRDTLLATILRHPVENIISIYFFWKTLAKGHDRLHDYFIDQNLTLLETARLPLLRNLFSKTYFEGFDMRRFNLIGRHDNRASTLLRLGVLTGRNFAAGVHENPTASSPARDQAKADPVLRRQLEDILAEDIRFYERFAH